MREHRLFAKSPWLNEEKSTLLGFSPIDLGLVFGYNLPIIFIHFYFKWVRVSIYGETDSFVDIFEVFKSDMLFHCIYIALVFWVLYLIKQLTLKVIVFLFLQFFGIAVLCLEVSAHNYYMVTGSMLNYDLLEYALRNISELKTIAVSNKDGSFLFIFIASLLLLFLTPWFFAYIVAIKQEKIKENTWFKFLPSKKLATLILSLCVVIFLLIPPLTNKNILFTRNLAFHLIHTYYENNFLTYKNYLENEWKTSVGSFLEHSFSTRKKNLVIVILESTRSDATSLYNKDIKTTPFLKQLGEKSLLAEKMFAIVPHTSKSLLSIHCGIEPKVTVGIEESETNGIPVKCLPELLNEIGYKTAFFQTATEHFENRRSLVANFGHQEFYPGNKLPKQHYQPTNYFGYEDQILLKPSREWHKKKMKDDPKSPFMITYLTNTTHHDYTLPSTHRYQWFHSNQYFNKYLNAVNYVDSFVSKLIQQYKDLGLYRDTIFVFVGDHGEGFREHQIYGHSNISYREGIQVPFMVHDPSRFQKGLRIRGVHFQPDILPTIVDLLNFRLLNSVHRGLSLFEKKRNRAVFTHCWSKNTCVGRHDNFFKFIHFFNKKPDEFYAIDQDPQEENNIYLTSDPKLLEHWKAKTLNWYENNYRFYQRHKEQNLTSTSQGTSDNPL